MLHDDICLSTWLFSLEVPPYLLLHPVIRLTHTVLFVHHFYIILNLARRVDQANRLSRNDDCLDIRKKVMRIASAIILIFRDRNGALIVEAVATPPKRENILLL